MGAQISTSISNLNSTLKNDNYYNNLNNKSNNVKNDETQLKNTYMEVNSSNTEQFNSQIETNFVKTKEIKTQINNNFFESEKTNKNDENKSFYHPEAIRKNENSENFTSEQNSENNSFLNYAQQSDATNISINNIKKVKINEDSDKQKQNTTSTTNSTIEEIHFSTTTNFPKSACNSQWLMMWTVAAYSEENPSESDKFNLFNFYNYLPDRCNSGLSANCYDKFRKMNPPKTNSRRELMMWLSIAENFCRKRAQLNTVTSSYSQLLKRWRFVDGYL